MILTTVPALRRQGPIPPETAIYRVTFRDHRHHFDPATGRQPVAHPATLAGTLTVRGAQGVEVGSHQSPFVHPAETSTSLVSYAHTRSHRSQPKPQTLHVSPLCIQARSACQCSSRSRSSHSQAACAGSRRDLNSLFNRRILASCPRALSIPGSLQAVRPASLPATAPGPPVEETSAAAWSTPPRPPHRRAGPIRVLPACWGWHFPPLTCFVGVIVALLSCPSGEAGFNIIQRR